MADPSPEEITIIKEFRQRVGDVLGNAEKSSDDYLIRWLRARDMKIEQAEDLLRQSRNWRDENDIDNVLDKKFDDFFEKNFPFTSDGYDRSGRPVLSVTYQNGNWDLRKIEAADRAEDFKQYTAYMFETIVNKIRMQNVNRKGTDLVPVRQYILLVDYTGFTYAQLLSFSAVSKLLSFATTYEAHYPELLYKCIFINCPSFIGTLMNLIRPLVANKTFGKMFYYGYDREEWGPILDEIIDEDQLPPEFRGIEITRL